MQSSVVSFIGSVSSFSWMHPLPIRSCGKSRLSRFSFTPEIRLPLRFPPERLQLSPDFVRPVRFSCHIRLSGCLPLQCHIRLSGPHQLSYQAVRLPPSLQCHIRLSGCRFGYHIGCPAALRFVHFRINVHGLCPSPAKRIPRSFMITVPCSLVSVTSMSVPFVIPSASRRTDMKPNREDQRSPPRMFYLIPLCPVSLCPFPDPTSLHRLFLRRISKRLKRLKPRVKIFNA